MENLNFGNWFVVGVVCVNIEVVVWICEIFCLFFLDDIEDLVVVCFLNIVNLFGDVLYIFFFDWNICELREIEINDLR